MKIYNLYEDVFNSNITICIGKYKKFKKYIKKTFDIKIEQIAFGGCQYFFTNKKEGKIAAVIWIPNYDNINFLISSISHELNHAIDDIVNQFKLKRHTAIYLQEFYLLQILNEINKGKQE